jgi:hypothetical protein
MDRIEIKTLDFEISENISNTRQAKKTIKLRIFFWYNVDLHKSHTERDLCRLCRFFVGCVEKPSLNLTHPN